MDGVAKFAPQYLVGEQLGVGGMGIVNIGTMVTPAGERPVALKRVLRRAGTDAVAYAAASERIIQEARLVFQLTHANICQVLDLASNDDGTFIVMDLVSGLDLRALLSLLQRGGRSLDVPIALFIAAKIAEALDYAHRFRDKEGKPLRLVHGDVTPQNILLSRDGEVKLTDFGIARALGALAPGNELRGGTPGFIAPEVLKNSADHRADLFSLGMTVYVALGGQLDTAEGAARIDLKELASRRTEVTPLLIEILARATAANPDQRYATAGELEHACSVYLARHFPQVTRAALAELVSTEASGWSQPHDPGGANAPLSSLTRADATFFEGTRPSEKDAQANDANGLSPRQTHRFVEPASPWRRRALWIGAVTLMGVAGVIATTRTPAPVPVPVPVPGNGNANGNGNGNANANVNVNANANANANVNANVTPSPAAVPPPRTRSAHRPPSADPRAGKMGWLSVNAAPWGAVFLDGKKVADETPLFRLAVLSGVHEVTISNPSRARSSRAHRVKVEPGQSQTVSVRW